MIVEALTDNRNRTAADVRHLFTKNDGNLGATGRRRVAVRAARASCSSPADGVDEDELILAAADAGADDVELDGSTLPGHRPRRSSSARVREAVEAAGITIESAELDDGAEDDGRDRGRAGREAASCG